MLIAVAQDAFTAVDGTWWEAFESGGQDDHEFDHFAIFVGMYKKYHDGGRYERFPVPGDGHFGKFMIVKRHDATLQRFHTVTFFVKWNILTLCKSGWVKRKFEIGGPEPLPGKGETMKQQIMDYVPELYASDILPDGFELVEIGARLKACSQREAEEFFESHPEEDRYPHDGLMKSIWKEGKKQLKEHATQVGKEVAKEVAKEFLKETCGMQ